MKLSTKHKRVYFTRLRHKYYVAGRVLFLNNCMEMGAMILGYALESHLKHALSEKEVKNKDILFSHDLCKLFDECLNLGVFENVEVSRDLIQFANDVFNVRYPSQQVAKLEEMIDGNRFLMLTPSILIAYDDLLIHLDNSLWEMTGDYEASVGIIAALTANCTDTRIFFHCNAPAHSMIPKYLEVIRNNYPDHLSEIQLLERGVESLWSFEKINVSFAPYNDLLAAKPAKNFNYPGRILRDQDGKIVKMLSTSDFLRSSEEI